MYFSGVTHQNGYKSTCLCAVGRLVGPQGVLVPKNLPTYITNLGGVALALIYLFHMLCQPFQIFVGFFALWTLLILLHPTGSLVPLEAFPIVKLPVTFS